MNTEKIKSLLCELNPDFLDLLGFIEKEIESLKSNTKDKKSFSEKHNVLITYADQFQGEDESNLQSLNKFLNHDLEGVISHVHLLPFYPWTSDDGFSPTDYKKVEPSYGTWQDIEAIPQKKMFDCVFNHLSSQSTLFQQALKGDKNKEAMFHVYNKQEYETKEFQDDITKIVRPRTSPLFHEFEFSDGPKYVWTTFSKDQVDTNINNPHMVKYILETLFLYIRKGATYFRVDAVPFMWKELGTNCSHLPGTHTFVKLLRAIVEEVDSELLIITESNVPHHENVTYWGDDDEAHVIYNFSLAPLILHALTFKTNKYLNSWGDNVFRNSAKTTYLNFTATHDGMGMRGLEGIVPEEDVVELCKIAENKGGKVGKKRSRDGSTKPYELNCTWRSFLDDEGLGEQDLVNKIVHSHAIVMFFPGIGAHYAHNFFGTENWQEGFEESQIARRLNRKKIAYPLELTNLEKKIMEKLKKLIRLKSSHPCFHPNASVEMLDHSKTILSFIREYQGQRCLVLFNLAASACSVHIENRTHDLAPFDLQIQAVEKIYKR